ncbi:hypothetical protein J5226_09325 [Lysobacter sp. K5869]|uniref:hypothetical protein n=1 Tax=Lysobacter sp. K5869 TaxID=2820808 RepID=UPI001C061BA1|nr:hypothetical protein [Lysobacter sp. K5869]QWP78571.1 hypothetical protein J5226_09325 [Lysobacter sp. K5869]
MSGLWDAQQREWLQAMGYSVLALAGDEPAVPEAAEAPARSQPAQRTENARGDAGRRAAPAAEQRGPGTDPPLLRAVLRAARRQAGDAEVMALFDPAALRAPAAKRALWPRLRALRRSPRG